MGDGLKRAFSATARTRWDGALTPHMRRFLDKLAEHKDAVTRKDLGCVTSREEERARQLCRKLGLARVCRQKTGARRLGWQITTAGRQARETAGMKISAPSPAPRGEEPA